MISKFIHNFFRLESAAGILLIIAMLLAIIAENTGLKTFYDAFRDTHLSVYVGTAGLSKPLLLWINDGLMTIFFFLIGLELKREIMDGELSSADRILFPTVAAVGGMAVPALIYVALNWSDSANLTGWAIPTATDIAFALGILSLLGDRVPGALKVFLTTLAIFDDLGAILIIAFFYTDHLSMTALSISGICLIVLFLMNLLRMEAASLYAVVGVVLWVALLKSGVHATLAGVLLAFFIPMQNKAKSRSPLMELEEDLHPAVSYIILPLFAFANSGISLETLSMDTLRSPVPLGVMLGLFLGKQLGVFGLSWISVKIRICSLPPGINWKEIYGVALLCGIGFTMSLFIGSLAAEQGGPGLSEERVGIILGSCTSAVCGYFFLRYVLSKRRNKILSRH